MGSLELFSEAKISSLRQKSLQLTDYLERLLNSSVNNFHGGKKHFTIITPSDPNARGAQLSIRLEPGLLDTVLEHLEENGVIVDERKPDVIRVAPAPMYNSFLDVWSFIQIFNDACKTAVEHKGHTGNSVMLEGGKEEKGWNAIK